MRKLTKSLLCLALALGIAANASAANTTKSASQVTSAVTVTEAVDYVITGTTPFTTAGSIDLQNDDAVVIFKYIKPSVVKSQWLKYISFNGTTATTSNAWVGIYENGAIVYQHTRDGYTPLTVYSETNYGGDSKSDFAVWTTYNSASALDGFENNIRSLRLKRGYMLTLGTNPNGQGFSRVYVAQDEDLELTELPAQLRGRVGFVRVFPWNKVTKKGNAGGDTGQLNALNVTWFYDWSANSIDYDNYEYVPQHHHEGWPSWSTVTGLKANTILGNNEPDNKSDKREQYIPNTTDTATGLDSIELVFFHGSTGTNGSWISNAYAGGQRVGTPAMSGNMNWLSTFVNHAKEYNCRLDFQAAHCYWHSSGSGFNSSLNWYYSMYGLPIWITEFNYGANWTTETWPDSDRSATTNNQAHMLSGLKDIVTHLEANANVERYAIYNWVQDARSVYLNSALTPAGEWYAALKSNAAYSGDKQVPMTFTYYDPSDFALTYYDSNKRVTFRWNNRNGKQTDSCYVERKLPGESDFTPINVRYITLGPSNTFSADTLKGVTGVVTYRIHNFDSDGKSRYSEEATVSIGGAEGNDQVQFGSLTLSDASSSINTEFATEFSEKPMVFTGLMTQNNSTTVTVPYFASTGITKTDFDYIGLPWTQQSNSTSTYDESEELPFLAMAPGNYTYGDMSIEVGNVTLKGDTTEVTFSTPFAEGVTPVVLAEVNRASDKTNPIMHKVWDVTNTGFKCALFYEQGLGKKVSINHQLAYFAVTPGDECIDEDNSIYMAAGIGANTLYGATSRSEAFTLTTDEGLDTLLLEDPLIFGEMQTANTKVPAVLRKASTSSKSVTDEDGNKTSYIYGVRVKRILDKSVTSSGIDGKSTGDTFGWVVLHKQPRYDAVGIGGVEITTENPLQVSVVNRIVYVKGFEQFDLYTISGVKVAENATQVPGIYVVKAGKKTAKVMVK